MSDVAVFCRRQSALSKISFAEARKLTKHAMCRWDAGIKNIISIIARRRKSAAIVRPLDSSDPRSLDHPCHREAWLELARAIGLAMADQYFDQLHGK